jgi:DNA repair protein SbcD/Mre11
MRILHLADLHLGKSLYEHELYEDQSHALDSVVAAAELEMPAAVIIAGDVFDRAVPPVEAVTLFGHFVAELQATRSKPSVIIIPGNHDSAARLSFMSLVLKLAGVHVASEAETCDHPVTVERDGERARFWLVPFLTPGAFSLYSPDEAPVKIVGGDGQGDLFADAGSVADPVLRSQSELFQEALRRIGSARTGMAADEIPTADVLVCHAFAKGGAPSESERVFLGNAELVDGTAFESFDYAALGHLHRPQQVGTKGQYPGSILAYSFAETDTEHGFLSVDLKPGSSTAGFRPVRPLRRMVRIEGRFDDVLVDPKLDVYEADYIEAVLDDASTILNPMDALRKRFPWILSLRQAAFGHRDTAGTPAGDRVRSDGTVTGDFLAFYREMKGVDPSPAELALFTELAREAEHAAL